MDEETKRKYLRQTVVMTSVIVLAGIALLVLAGRVEQQSGAAGKHAYAFQKLAWILFATAGFVGGLRSIVLWRLSLRWIGRGMGLLMLGVIVSTNFDPSITAFYQNAFGAQPFGVSVTWWAVGIQLLLLGPPLLFLGPSLFALVQHGGRSSDGGLTTVILFGRELPASLQRDRRRVLFCGGYLLALFVGWLVYTSQRGI